MRWIHLLLLAIFPCHSAIFAVENSMQLTPNMGDLASYRSALLKNAVGQAKQQCIADHLCEPIESLSIDSSIGNNTIYARSMTVSVRQSAYSYDIFDDQIRLKVIAKIDISPTTESELLQRLNKQAHGTVKYLQSIALGKKVPTQWNIASETLSNKVDSVRLYPRGLNAELQLFSDSLQDIGIMREIGVVLWNVSLDQLHVTSVDGKHKEVATVTLNSFLAPDDWIVISRCDQHLDSPLCRKYSRFVLTAVMVDPSGNVLGSQSATMVEFAQNNYLRVEMPEASPSATLYLKVKKME